MNKLSLLCTTMLLASGMASAQPDNFQPIGYYGGSPEKGEFGKVLMDREGVQYLVYNDFQDNINVARFINGSWEQFSPLDGGPVGKHRDFDAAISPDGTIYVAGLNASAFGVDVHQLKDGQWIQLGSGSLESSYRLPAIEVDNSGTPYVMFHRSDNWVDVDYWDGTAFVDTLASDQLVNSANSDMTIDASGNLYVIAANTGGKVFQYSQGTWTDLGDSIPGTLLWDAKITANNSNLYVALESRADDNLYVNTFENGNWSQLTATPVNTSTVRHFDIAVDADGEVVVAWEPDSSPKVYLEHYINNDWNQVFSSASTGKYPSLTYHYLGHIMASYQDAAYGYKISTVATPAANGGIPVTDENGDPAGTEVDPIYQAEKDQYVLQAATAGWDKNAADDFDGNYHSLSGTPTHLSEFENDLPAPSEADPVYNSEKQNFVAQADTTGWDKNAADDFSGDYQDLTNTPTKLSDFTNDLEMPAPAFEFPDGFAMIAADQTQMPTCPQGFYPDQIHYNVGNTNNAVLYACISGTGPLSCTDFKNGSEAFTVACNDNTAEGYYWEVGQKVDEYGFDGMTSSNIEPACNAQTVGTTAETAAWRYTTPEQGFWNVRTDWCRVNNGSNPNCQGEQGQSFSCSDPHCGSYVATCRQQ